MKIIRINLLGYFKKKEWGRGYICYTQREIHYVVSDQRGHSGKFKMLSS